MYQKTEVQSPEKRRTGDTGIPAGTQRRFEEQYGVSFADVRVHYNSPMPARLGALAFARGTQVYLGPGQERHLNHELGHVIQQKRGLVPATVRVGGYPVNDDARLEREADVIAAFRGPAVREERGQEGAAQLTTADIEYKVNGAPISNYVRGELVTEGHGTPGISHAEQRVWDLASARILSQLQRGCHVDIVFSIDEPVCDGCQDWFDNTLYPKLSETGGSFTLSVVVNHSAPVEVLGPDKTVWTNEVALSSTWNRLDSYDRCDRFMREGREKDGKLGAQMDPTSTLDAYALITDYIGENRELQNKLLTLLKEAKQNVLTSENIAFYPDIARNRVGQMDLYQLLRELAGITYENKPLEYALMMLSVDENLLRSLLQDYLQMYLAYNYEETYEKIGEDGKMEEEPKNLHFYFPGSVSCL